MDASSQALARYFAGRIEKAQTALKTLNLSRYADDITMMMPTSAEGFGRFVHFCEALAAMVDRTVPSAAEGAAVRTLARDARDLLTMYERRAARGL